MSNRMEQPIIPESPELTQFREDYTSAFVDTVDFLGIDGEPYFLTLRPADLGMEDERGYEELSVDERLVILDVATQTLDCDFTQHPTRSYTVRSETDEEIEVQIFETNRSEIGMFLHKILYADGSTTLVLAPYDATITS